MEHIFHLSWHDCAMGRSAPRAASLRSLASRFSEPGSTAVRHSGGSLPHSGKRQANHWPGSTNQAEDCHITLRPGRPKLPNFNFKCQISGQNLLSQAFLIPGYFGLRDDLSRHNVVGCTELCTSLMGEGKCRGNTCQTVSVIIKR